MIVVAQGKKSNDPVQQALREKKAKWNKKVSAFIDDLIHVKKMMNGWPSKFLMERSRITEPLPKDPATILGALAGDFSEIVNEGNDIIASQISYSQTRKKKQPKQLNLPLPATPTPAPMTPMNDLSQQLSLPSVATTQLDELLISEGSNPFSRFLASNPFSNVFHGVKDIFTKDQIEPLKRRNRGSLLKQAHNLYKLCSKFQSDIVKFNVESEDTIGLAEAIEDLIDIEKKHLALVKTIGVFADDIAKFNKPAETPTDTSGDSGTTEPPSDAKKPAKPPAQPPAAPPPTEQDDAVRSLTLGSANEIAKDWSQVESVWLDLDPNLRKELGTLVNEFEKEVNEPAKTFLATRLVSSYQRVLADLNMKAKEKGFPEIRSLSQYYLLSSKAQEMYQLEVLADKAVRKWLGKSLTNLFSKKNSSNRISAYEGAMEMRQGLNHLMDVLEKDFEATTLYEVLNKEVDPNLSRMQRAIDSITDSIIDDLRAPKPDLSETAQKQRKKLLDAIERRQMLNITRRMVQTNYTTLTQSLKQPKPTVTK